jgi:hypothetical protein
LPALPSSLRSLRSVRSAWPAMALLALTYAVAAAANGKRAPVSIPASAAAALAPAEPEPEPEPEPAGGPLSCRPERPPSAAPRVPAAVVEPPGDAPPAPPVAANATAAILGLNRRAIVAYEQLETARARRLLEEGLRRCQRAGQARGDLAALTHLNLGIVLAGGFKQRGLAVQQFRRALFLRPGIQPLGRLVTPDITAAYAEAGTGGQP